MYDLAQAFIEEGHQVTVITPDSTPKEHIRISQQDGVSLVQVKAFETKDINYVSRTLAEFINPFLIWHKLKKSSEFINTQYDGIIWYSPTIFWGPLIKRLKRQYGVRAYLILRDIFPDWALDLGLIKKGLAYKFLKMVEIFQYRQADIIGVQSPNNLKYFKERNQRVKADIEVLWNWMGRVKQIECSIDLSKTPLAGRRIFVYAGNMGVAQGMDRLVNLVRCLNDHRDVGFVFVGRGSEVNKIKDLVEGYGLSNTLFFDEIDPAEIPGLFMQCHGGLISLDSRHHSHNIPGKALTYLNSNLPIFGIVNSENDLIKLTKDLNVGRVIGLTNATETYSNFISFLKNFRNRADSIEACMRAKEIFAPKHTVRKILKYFLVKY
jgi:glycosyltransferase involved in cell wall biosynthesis